TDVSDLTTRGTDVSVWALSSPAGAARLDTPYSFDSRWRALLPLGNGVDAAVLLLDTSTIGVMLQHPGQAPPLRRPAAVSAKSRHGSVGDRINQLCALMADPNNDKAVRNLVPRDAYQGALCPT